MSLWLLHLGIYAYRREFLLALTQMPQSRLEKLESLEQLRLGSGGVDPGADRQARRGDRHCGGLCQVCCTAAMSFVPSIVGGPAMFTISFTEPSLDDIESFRKRDQSRIFNEIEEQLSHQPDVATRRRKRFRRNRVSEWELRIEVFRVFYDVDIDASRVEVKLVGRKQGKPTLRAGPGVEL